MINDLLSHLSGFAGGIKDAFPLNDTPWFIYPLLIVALLLSLSIHEYGHAWMADKLGDPGPREAGRLTLSPFAHLDPLGTLLMIVSVLTGLPVGWGKPVKTDPDLYTVDRRTGVGLVAMAGPIANLLAAVALAIPSRILMYVLSEWRIDPLFAWPLLFIFILCVFTMLVSISLFTFNLVPVYPLDGSHVLACILPQDIATVYTRFMKRYGVYLFLGLTTTGVLSRLLGPIVIGLFRLLIGM